MHTSIGNLVFHCHYNFEFLYTSCLVLFEKLKARRFNKYMKFQVSQCVCVRVSVCTKLPKTNKHQTKSQLKSHCVAIPFTHTHTHSHIQSQCYWLFALVFVLCFKVNPSLIYLTETFEGFLKSSPRYFKDFYLNHDKILFLQENSYADFANTFVERINASLLCDTFK